MSKILLTAVVGSVTGFLFQYFHIPLPWMLGPLAGILGLAVYSRDSVSWPVGLRNTGLVVLGYMMGRPFSPAVGNQIAGQLPMMLGMTVVLIIFSLAIGYVTHRQTRISLASCVLGTVPGGLSQMVILGEEIAAADATIVTFMQTLRVLAVVFCVPFLITHGFIGGSAAVPPPPAAPVAAVAGPEAALVYLAAVLAGAWLAVRFKLPTPYLLGPMLATCCLVLSGFPPPSLPPALVIAAQLSVGIYMGTNIDIDNLAKCRKIFPYALMNVLAVIAFSLVLGIFLARYAPTTLITGFLSAAPGGMAEMGLAAMLVNAELSMVVSFHLFRLLFILLVLPFFLKLWLGAAPAGGAQAEGDRM